MLHSSSPCHPCVNVNMKCYSVFVQGFILHSISQPAGLQLLFTQIAVQLISSHVCKNSYSYPIEIFMNHWPPFAGHICKYSRCNYFKRKIFFWQKFFFCCHSEWSGHIGQPGTTEFDWADNIGDWCLWGYCHLSGFAQSTLGQPVCSVSGFDHLIVGM